jgi:hypothetical protein
MAGWPQGWLGGQRLQNTVCSHYLTQSKIDDFSHVVHLEMIFKLIYLHGHIHSMYIYKQIRRHCPRLRSLRHNARPAPAGLTWVKFPGSAGAPLRSTPARTPPSSRIDVGQGRDVFWKSKGIIPSKRETVFNTWFGQFGALWKKEKKKKSRGTISILHHTLLQRED